MLNHSVSNDINFTEFFALEYSKTCCYTLLVPNHPPPIWPEFCSHLILMEWNPLSLLQAFSALSWLVNVTDKNSLAEIRRLFVKTHDSTRQFITGSTIKIENGRYLSKDRFMLVLCRIRNNHPLTSDINSSFHFVFFLCPHSSIIQIMIHMRIVRSQMRIPLPVHWRASRKTTSCSSRTTFYHVFSFGRYDSVCHTTSGTP